MKIVVVVSTRPNFPKAAPLLNLLAAEPDRFNPILVHTGQHYDVNMSDVFFADLGIPEPSHHLAVGSGSHGEVTGKTLIAFESVLQDDPADLVVVFGDVTGTLACALAAAKLHVPVAHVEAGLRSRDKQMPEELNRILTDALSAFLFTPSRDADDNLRAEGVEESRIHLVGNIMVDSLLRAEARIDTAKICAELGVPDQFAYTTLHRDFNVDTAEALSACVDCLEAAQRHIPIVFPMHPRTRSRIETFGLGERLAGLSNVNVIDPVGYQASLALQKEATLVITDSAGLQEESTVFKTPCLTMRPNTERPVTVEVGSATIVNLDAAAVEKGTLDVLGGRYKDSQVPDMWDGRTSERIVEILGKMA